MSRLKNLLSSLRQETPPPPMIGEFDGESGYHSDALALRMRRPIVIGSIVLLLFVVGLFVWAAVSPIYGAVVASGVVKVEGNASEIRHLEPAIIRQILVREGQHVRKGQLLIRFDDSVALATVQVLQAAVDTANAQIARFRAEATNAPDIDFPSDLLQRQNEPQVAALLSSQRTLFLTHMMLYRSQAEVTQSQIAQLGNQIAGLRAQVDSTDGQSTLIQQELNGVRSLNHDGYAPVTRLLALQRNAVALKGQRGSILSDIARAQQTIGSARIQLSQLDQKRQTDAADGIRASQEQLTETEPKLRSAHESLSQVEMRAPVDGFVLNLTQRSEGGASAATELLMSIVPANAHLYIDARVPSRDVATLSVGQPTHLTLVAFNPRTTPQIEGRVESVGADAVEDPQTRTSTIDVRIAVDPEKLAKAGPNVRLSPGMPVAVAIVTSHRTILDYVIGPLSESMHGALKEQ